jgi:hypothetical protein
LIIVIVEVMHRSFVVRESPFLLRHSVFVGSPWDMGQETIFESSLTPPPL